MLRPGQNRFESLDLDGRLPSNRVSAWMFGVVVAGPLVAYGAYCLLKQHAWIVLVRLGGTAWDRQGPVFQWHGQPAMALGLIFMGAGLFAHFQCFWAPDRILGRFADIGKLVALLLLIAGLGWWTYLTIW